MQVHLFLTHAEPEIKAIWSDSSLAEFKMILKDEIARYGLAIEFGPAVSLAGKILTGIIQLNYLQLKNYQINNIIFLPLVILIQNSNKAF